LDGVSLKVYPDQRLAIVGPSGSGKTLLLRAMVLLDPLQSGEIRWQGRLVSHSDVPGFRRQAIYLHQRPSLREPTVEASLRQPFSLRANRARQFDRERLVGLLAELGRDASFLDKRSRDLSGGEMQIVALVRALQLEPTLLLLDEPTAALDARTAEAAERLLHGWIEKVPGRAMVWVSHDPAQSDRMAQTTVQMMGGRIVDGD
jgi:putative ABC transport system ATP-binding protein